MALEDMIERVQQAVDVRRVFGEPYVRDGVTVIPAAAVRAGAGGGSGDDPERRFGFATRWVGWWSISLARQPAT